MCTVTFIPREVGYYLAMNRDEQLKRIAGLPPQRRIVDGRTVLCPSEPGGGTWISLNDSRVCFALINWYSVQTRVKESAVSRGEVVNSISSCISIGEAQERLRRLPLTRVNPFRLIGIFPDDREVIEWSWDLSQLLWKEHPWEIRQWISSGYHEPTAQVTRSAAFRKAQLDDSAGTLDWLFGLHRSHDPERGPFSTCMHRPDAATVSYTEIDASTDRSSMRYLSGSPCMNSQPGSSSFIDDTNCACSMR